MSDFLFEYAHEWTDRHLSSCKSYRKNNHFGRRLNKWQKIYNKGFGCDSGTTPTTTKASTQEPTEAPTQAPTERPTETTTTTAAPGPQCGCYVENEEITIEKDKCVLDLGRVTDVTTTWSLTFEFKMKSLPYNTSKDILSGIGF